MKLFCLVTEDVYGRPRVITDIVSGLPEVYITEANATKKCDDLNKETDGGYFVEPFETED